MFICQQTHKSHRSFHLITITLLFTHKTIECVHQQDQEREQGIQLPVSHTLIDHHICHGVRPLGRHVKNRSLSFSGIHCISMDKWIALLRCSTISTKC